MDLFVHVLISWETIWQKKRHRCTLPRVANSACLRSGLQEGTSKRKTMLPKPGVPSAACYMLVLCTAPMPILQSLYSKKSISTSFTIFWNWSNLPTAPVTWSICQTAGVQVLFQLPSLYCRLLSILYIPFPEGCLRRPTFGDTWMILVIKKEAQKDTKHAKVSSNLR